MNEWIDEHKADRQNNPPVVTIKLDTIIETLLKV